MDESFNQETKQEMADSGFLVCEPRRTLAAALSFARAHGAELLSGALLAVMGLQMLAVISRKSITVDEIVMIPAAYYHLAAGNFQLINEHPPLSKIVAAVPLLFVQPEEARADQINAPLNSPNAKWGYQESFWADNAKRFDSLSFWPRVPMILLTVVLGFLVFRFARELFGPRAAVLAVALFSLEPTVLAHGRVVQTDIPAAFGYLLLFMALSRYAREQTWRRAAWLGAAAAIAILAKFSMLLAGPVLAVFFLGLWWRASRSNQPLATVATHAVIVLAVIVLVINAAYFFQHRPFVDADGEWIQNTFPAHSRAATSAVVTLAHLLPIDFVLGIFFQFSHNSAGHSASLLGLHSQQGWWYYFPVAFALKTTIPFLLLSLASLAWGSYEWIKNRDRRFLWLLAPFAVYTIFVLFSHIDIGVRYYLPAYPFLFILSAALLDRLLKVRRAYLLGPLVAVSLLAWMGVEAARAYPDHMTYMNQIAFRAPHWWYLSDSNVEWGDDLRAVATYLHDRGETRVNDGTLGGFFTFRFYGIERVDALAAEKPDLPRYTAVGASYLNGSTVPRQASDGRELTDDERLNAFDAYRRRTPEAVFGSIYLYREDRH